MPTYVYRRVDNDERVTLHMTITELMKRQRRDGSITLDDGIEAIRDFTALRIGAQTEWTEPLLSDAAAVHPEQIPEARADSVRRGVPTDFAPDGRAIFTSRSHRKRYCRAIGLHDNDGGYGDP